MSWIVAGGQGASIGLINGECVAGLHGDGATEPQLYVPCDLPRTAGTRQA
jgi:hypothetical protein